MNSRDLQVDSWGLGGNHTDLPDIPSARALFPHVFICVLRSPRFLVVKPLAVFQEMIPIHMIIQNYAAKAHSLAPTFGILQNLKEKFVLNGNTKT